MNANVYILFQEYVVLIADIPKSYQDSAKSCDDHIKNVIKVVFLPLYLK